MHHDFLDSCKRRDRWLPVVALLGTLVTGSTAVAQSTGGIGSPERSSPGGVVERYAEALIAKDWATCVDLTDPAELARNKAAFIPIFQRDSSGQLASRILGAPRQLVVSSLSDREFNARLLAFFVATSSQGSALERFQGVEIFGTANPAPDRAFVIYQWRLPATERPIRGVQAMELRQVGGQWRLKMLADFEGLREMLVGEYPLRR
jgi:hypothetical protein